MASSRNVRELAAQLFSRIAAEEGTLTHNTEGSTWVELLCSKTAPDGEEEALLRDATANLARRCLIAATSAVAVLGEATSPPTSREATYSCPECGSNDVELCFPAWVAANDIDDRARWQLDLEAEPEDDSDKGWCPRCGEHVVLREEPHGP